VPERAKVEKGIREIRPGVFEVRYAGVSRTTDRGIRAARQLHGKLMTEVAEGKHGGEKSTLSWLLDDWLRHRKSAGRAPRTLAEDRRKIDTIIRPSLGSRRLDRLKVADINRFYDDQRVQGRHEPTLLACHRILRAALNYALRNEWVPRNVMVNVEKPTPEAFDQEVPYGEDIQRLLQEAHRTGNDRMAGIITVAALSGMRQGEVCGLRFSDVDLASGMVMVRRSIWCSGSKSAGTFQWGIKTPKSGKGRPFGLTELGLAVIRLRWEDVARAAALLEAEVPEDPYVWSTDGLGAHPLMPTYVSLTFRNIRKRVGLDCRFHDLRRFAGTEMVAAGIDPRTVADRLGHSDPSLTLRLYARSRPASDDAAAEAIERALGTGNPRSDAYSAQD
jgi:integrase